MATEILTAERLRELLDYDPLTGIFTWRTRRGSVPRGGVAGHLGAHRYVVIKLGRRRHRAHRLAWLHTHGVWPALHIDHINGVRHDNRLVNLREANHSENAQNQPHLRANNTSGFLGVTWSARDKRWQAGININKKRIHLGHFHTAEEASAAYREAKARLHPFSSLTR